MRMIGAAVFAVTAIWLTPFSGYAASQNGKPHGTRTTALEPQVRSENSRTMTGRPKDLDPRIPWLADLGMPQSGGPEPLLPVESYPLPPKCGVYDVWADRGLVVVVTRLWRQPFTMTAMDPTGSVVWTRTSAERPNWPQDLGPLPQAAGIGVDNLMIGGAGVSKSEHARAYKDGWVIVGAREERAPPEHIRQQNPDRERERRLRNAEHLQRAEPWIGKRLRIKDLPLFDPGLHKRKNRREWLRPALRGTVLEQSGQILRVNRNGSLWVAFSLDNPRGLSDSELTDARRESQLLEQWPVIALFGESGRLRGYVIGDHQTWEPGGGFTDEAYFTRVRGNKLIRYAPIPR